MEFGDRLEISYVMGGLAREFEADLSALVIQWLDDAAESGMPLDPRIWHSDGVRSTYPACIAFRAAAEQGPAAAERYLRVLREGFMCHRRKLDGPEALVAEARRAGLDAQRFRIDLESNAILEAFAGDLEESRTIPDAAREAGLATEGSHGSKVERLAFPALRFIPEDGGEERWVGGDNSYEEWREAAIAAGASPSAEPHPDVPARPAALPQHGHGGARGGLRPARPARRRGGVAPRKRVARCAACRCSVESSGSSPSAG